MRGQRVLWCATLVLFQLKVRRSPNVSDVEISIESGDESASEVATEAIADAIDTAIEAEQSFEIGVVAGELNAVKDQVAMHDGLIQLHSHEGFVTVGDLRECEERLVARIDAISPPMEEVIDEPVEETVEETSEEETKTDDPPHSRRNRGSIAERYYKSSKL
jgi:hypothetical protein